MNYELFCQNNIKKYIDSIEANNLELISARRQLSADIIGSKIGIYPDDPQIGLDYFPVNQARLELRATQSFDFPTSYLFKSWLSDYKGEKAKKLYLLKRREILKDARNIIIEIIYLNKLLVLLDNRKKNVDNLNLIARKRIDAGDINAIDKNKINLEYMQAMLDYQLTEADYKKSLVRLNSLNGNKPLIVTDTDFPDIELPNEEDELLKEYIANDILLNIASIDTLISESQISFSKSLNLPGLLIGYRMDLIADKPQHGLIFGFSIPLWQNKFAVEYSEEQKEANVLAYNSINNESVTNLKTLFSQYQYFSKTFSDAMNISSSTNNINLLNMALNSGEISITDYLIETSKYYQINQSLLKLEFNITQLKSLMKSYEL